MSERTAKQHFFCTVWQNGAAQPNNIHSNLGGKRYAKAFYPFAVQHLRVLYFFFALGSIRFGVSFFLIRRTKHTWPLFSAQIVCFCCCCCIRIPIPCANAIDSLSISFFHPTAIRFENPFYRAQYACRCEMCFFCFALFWMCVFWNFVIDLALNDFLCSIVNRWQSIPAASTCVVQTVRLQHDGKCKSYNFHDDKKWRK